MRQLKREVKIGNVTIGGNESRWRCRPCCNVPVEDIEGNVAQAKRCEAAGCQILRVTCPSAADAKCIEARQERPSISPSWQTSTSTTRRLSPVPTSGVDKIRINPGNIGA